MILPISSFGVMNAMGIAYGSLIISMVRNLSAFRGTFGLRTLRPCTFITFLRKRRFGFAGPSGRGLGILRSGTRTSIAKFAGRLMYFTMPSNSIPNVERVLRTTRNFSKRTARITQHFLFENSFSEIFNRHGKSQCIIAYLLERGRTTCSRCEICDPNEIFSKA